MAWSEPARRRFRVRYRHNGQKMHDSTHADSEAADERRLILEASLGRRKRLYEPGPAPKLVDWLPVWWSHRRVGLAVSKRDESLLRTHILPKSSNRRGSATNENTAPDRHHESSPPSNNRYWKRYNNGGYRPPNQTRPAVSVSATSYIRTYREQCLPGPVMPSSRQAGR